MRGDGPGFGDLIAFWRAATADSCKTHENLHPRVLLALPLSPLLHASLSLPQAPCIVCVCVCVCVCQPWSQWDHWNTILGDNGLLLQDHKTQLSNLTTELESVFFRAKKTKTTNPVHLSPRHPRELSSVFPCTHFLRANSCFCMLNTEESITWQVFCFFFLFFFPAIPHCVYPANAD